MHMDKFEKYWLYAVSITLGAFMAALMAGAIVFGVRAPDAGGFINPQQLQDTEFANPGLRDMGNNHFEAVMLAQVWFFTPSELRVPLGATVTFKVTSADVTHGFFIEQHNVNFELVPGHISVATATFDRPGRFRIICHEYCGRSHHTMLAWIIVGEETETALGE